jgi:hypothetical protein
MKAIIKKFGNSLHIVLGKKDGFALNQEVEVLPLTSGPDLPKLESTPKPAEIVKPAINPFEVPDEQEQDFLNKYAASNPLGKSSLYTMACKQFNKARVDALILTLPLNQR